MSHDFGIPTEQEVVVKRTFRWTVWLTALLVAAAGCATDEDGTQAQPTPTPVEPASTIDVTLQEWAVLPSPSVGAAGDVTFDVSNAGEREHEFVVIRTDLDHGELPTLEDGSVDEEAVDIVGEVEELDPGATGSVSLDLETGNYALMCNLVHEEHSEEDEDGEAAVHVHYRLGMHTGFTVS